MRIKNVIFRRELGEDLEIIMLEMSVEEQEERVRARHEGNQHAVDIMKVDFNISNFVQFCSIEILPFFHGQGSLFLACSFCHKFKSEVRIFFIGNL